MTHDSTIDINSVLNTGFSSASSGSQYWVRENTVVQRKGYNSSALLEGSEYIIM
jgi:hypothetical protein